MAEDKRPRTSGAPVSSLSPADLEAIEDTLDFEVQLESLNQWQLAWRRFKKHRLAVLGSGIFLSIVVVAIVGPIFNPFDSTSIGLPDKIVYAGRPPSWVSGQWNPLLLMGETGRLQRDVFQLVINGARLSLVISVLATTISVIIGTAWGGVAGYFGGFLDTVLMRIVDAILSLPLLFVILVASKFLGSGSWVTVTPDLRTARLGRHRATGPEPVPEPAGGGVRGRGARGRRLRRPDHLPAHPARTPCRRSSSRRPCRSPASSSARRSSATSASAST